MQPEYLWLSLSAVKVRRKIGKNVIMHQPLKRQTPHLCVMLEPGVNGVGCRPWGERDRYRVVTVIFELGEKDWMKKYPPASYSPLDWWTILIQDCSLNFNSAYEKNIVIGSWFTMRRWEMIDWCLVCATTSPFSLVVSAFAYSPSHHCSMSKIMEFTVLPN